MVKLTDDYFVDVNGTTYTLMLDKHKVDKNGKPETEAVGYYMSLASAVKAAADDRIGHKLANGSYNLAEAVKLIQEITAEFSSLLTEKCGRMIAK